MLKTMKLVLYGDPRTKKNSARILKAHANRRIVAPSEAFMQYQEKCLWQIKRPYNPITARVNVRCVYYMATRRKVDLANLIEATCDILVKAKVLADDNSQIVAAHDGSRVDYDKKNPRAEIWIEEMDGLYGLSKQKVLRHICRPTVELPPARNRTKKPRKRRTALSHNGC